MAAALFLFRPSPSTQSLIGSNPRQTSNLSSISTPFSLAKPNNRRSSTYSRIPFLRSPVNPYFQNRSSPSLFATNLSGKLQLPFSGGDDDDEVSHGGGGDGGDNSTGWSGGADDGGDDSNSDSGSSIEGFGPLGLLLGLLNGRRSRVAADPRFPIKVLMEELVGVTTRVIGNMALRPNFELIEPDIVVGFIVNLTLMSLLAATVFPCSSNIQPILVSFPNFKPSSFSLINWLRTLRLFGAALSSRLMRKMDRYFGTTSHPPPTIFNADMLAVHMSLSSNLKNQTLTGIEVMLGNGLPLSVFKSSVVRLSCSVGGTVDVVMPPNGAAAGFEAFAFVAVLAEFECFADISMKFLGFLLSLSVPIVLFFSGWHF